LKQTSFLIFFEDGRPNNKNTKMKSNTGSVSVTVFRDSDFYANSVLRDRELVDGYPRGVVVVTARWSGAASVSHSQR